MHSLLLVGLLRALTLPDSTPSRCDGKTVSTVVIRRSARTMMDKARAPAWSRAILQPLLLGTPTRESAIRPFLQLKDGGPCTEQRRAESERLLRLQPYLADATVQVVDEADGRVRVEIETIDDLRPILGLGLKGARPTIAEFGNNNVDGSGQLVSARWRDGRAFRDGFGVRYTDYHLFNRPNIASVVLDRLPLGSFIAASLARPFYTDLQNGAGFMGYLRDDGYVGFVRPSGDPLSLEIVRERADLGIAFHLHTKGSAQLLLGALASFDKRTTAAKPVIITDSGFVQTPDKSLVDRYTTTEATRVGLVTGVRYLRFAKAVGFDALEGVQDIGRGVQLATVFGQTLGGSFKGPFITTDLYVGVGGTESFLGLRSQVEARKGTTGWTGIVGSGRLAWYSKPSKRQTRLWSLEYVGASKADAPFQLTVDDPQTGIRGYVGSRLAGSQRLILRAERRWVMPGISTYFGWGVAGFADAAQMFKGDAPFGANGTRGTVGVSLLAAVPRESRSLARLDFGLPFIPDKSAKDFAIRFTYSIIGRSFWREPADITRARLGAASSDIFSWP